jgi:hypothetical protein
MALLHCGQNEREGFIIDVEDGRRNMQTFKKLPMHMPNMKTRLTNKTLTMFYTMSS